MITIDDIKNAIRKTAWDFLADDGVAEEGKMTVSVEESESDKCLAAIRKHLPEGATADFTGNSDTNADGDTTDDICIEWATE